MSSHPEVIQVCSNIDIDSDLIDAAKRMRCSRCGREKWMKYATETSDPKLRGWSLGEPTEGPNGLDS